MLFDVLTMVAFRAGKPEQPFLQDWVIPVPKRERKTKSTLTVSDPEQAVLTPTVGAAARVVVRKITPAIAISRIILANCGPLPLTQVGSPALPVGEPLSVGLQAFFL